MPDDGMSQPSSGLLPTVLGRLTTVLGAIAASLPVLSIILYLIVQSGYAGFYGTFGITPEEAGVGQAVMITHTALFLGQLTFVLLFLLLLAIPWLVPPRQASDWYAFACVGLALLAIGIRASMREGTGVGFGNTLCIIASVYLLRAASLLGRYLDERHGQTKKPVRRQRSRRKAFVAPMLSAALIFLVYGVVSLQDRLLEAGATSAERLAHGEAVKPGWFDHLLDVPVRPVDVIWLGDSRAPTELKDLDRPLYLGQADGIGVFFDRRRNQTVRLPAGTFALCTTLPTEHDTAMGTRRCPRDRRATAQTTSTSRPSTKGHRVR